MKFILPDIFIPKENKIIEVKSTYTYSEISEDSLAINTQKALACLSDGYNFEFWIISEKGKLTIFD